MADQKKWFKVWTTILLDPHHMNMSIQNVGRWTRLGALMVSQGDNGKLSLTPPAKAFCLAMECDTFEGAIDALKVLPNVQIEEGKFDNGETTVSILNWFKYQVDSTGYERVKRSRYKRRGEESRVEQEKKREEITTGARPQKAEAAPPPKPAAPYQIPDKIKDPVGNLVIAYKLFKKIPKDDRAWDKVHFGRSKHSTKALLEICGTHDAAVDAIADISAGLEAKGLDWTIETILKHAHDWKRKRGLRNAELENGTGISMATKSRLGLTSANPRGGGLVPAGASFAGVRDMPIAKPRAKADDGSSNTNDGGAL